MSNKKFFSRVKLDDTTLWLTSILCIAICFLLAMTSVYGIVMAILNPQALIPSQGNPNRPESGDRPFKQNVTVNMSYDTTDAETISGVTAKNAILVDLTTGKIVAGKSSPAELKPASMTKVMTLIVVIESLNHEDAMNDMVPVTAEHIRLKSEREMSGQLGNSSYPAGEYSVKTLLNHLIMESSGVAALALADYIAGSEAAFVKLMNEKAEEMELAHTNFVTCDGTDKGYHHSTAKDIAKIMAYAMKNTHCANFLSALSYTDEEGGLIYHKPLVHNFFQQNGTYAEYKSKTAKIIAAKSGWTGNVANNDSGGCMVTYAKGNNGHEYIVVVAGTTGTKFTMDPDQAAYTAVVDTIKILDNYVK